MAQSFVKRRAGVADRRRRPDLLRAGGLLLAFTALGVSTGRACGVEVAELTARFRYLAAAQAREATAAPLSNAEGDIAWRWSHALAALGEMLAATGDTSYAGWFVRIAEAVLAERDDRHGRVDTWRHRVCPTWGSTGYSEGWHTVWAVHSGMIAAPLARFAEIVRADSCLTERYGPEARAYVRAAQEALAVHDAQYRDAPNPAEGYLMRLGQRLPLNQVSAVGRAWLLSDAAASDTVYAARLRKLAAHVRSRLRLAGDGAYEWGYLPPLEGGGVDFDDTAHAALTADFIAICSERGVVFDAADVARLARTFLQRVAPEGRGAAADLTGSGAARDPAQALQWGRIARHDPAARERFATLYRTLRLLPRDASLEMLGLAHLIAAAGTAKRVPPPGGVRGE